MFQNNELATRVRFHTTPLVLSEVVKRVKQDMNGSVLNMLDSPGDSIARAVSKYEKQVNDHIKTDGSIAQVRADIERLNAEIKNISQAKSEGRFLRSSIGARVSDLQVKLGPLEETGRSENQGLFIVDQDNDAHPPSRGRRGSKKQHR